MTDDTTPWTSGPWYGLEIEYRRCQVCGGEDVGPTEGESCENCDGGFHPMTRADEDLAALAPELAAWGLRNAPASELAKKLRNIG